METGHKSIKVYIEHILDAIRQIENYTNGFSESDFLNDRKTQDAVIRNFEIIGEATKRIPNDFRDLHKNISWRQMAGMRDVMIHDYIGIDKWAVWKTVVENIPELKQNLTLIINELSK